MTPGRWALGALLLVGAALRIHGLTDHGLWIDEYGTWWTVAGDDLAATWDRALAIHGQSPLYYLIVDLCTEVLGIGRASLRLPSLLAGLGTLALAYPLGRAVFGDRRWALLCVLTFAVDGRLIYYSQEARPYSLALLFTVAAFIFHVRAVARSDARDRFVAAALTLLAYYTHYFFGVIVLVQAIHLVVTQRGRERRWEWWRPWVASGVGLGFAMIPGLLQLRSVFVRRATLDWINVPAEGWAGLDMAAELLDPVVFLPVLGVVVLAQWRNALNPDRAAADVWLGLLCFAVPFVVFAVLSPLVGVELAHTRYLAMTAPAVPLLMAFLLGVPGPGRAWTVAPLLLFLALVCGTQLRPQIQRSDGPFWWFYQHGWETAMSQLVDGYQEGDVILYRTGFVELDLLVRGTASPMTREFVEWPVLAHLPSDRRFERLALAYSDSAVMRERLAEQVPFVDSPGGRFRRLWVIGLDPVDTTRTNFDRLIAMAQLGRPLVLSGAWNHGVVELLLLRAPPAAQPAGEAH